MYRHSFRLVTVYSALLGLAACAATNGDGVHAGIDAEPSPWLVVFDANSVDAEPWVHWAADGRRYQARLSVAPFAVRVARQPNADGAATSVHAQASTAGHVNGRLPHVYVVISNLPSRDPSATVTYVDADFFDDIAVTRRTFKGATLADVSDFVLQMVNNAAPANAPWRLRPALDALSAHGTLTSDSPHGIQQWLETNVQSALGLPSTGGRTLLTELPFDVTYGGVESVNRVSLALLIPNGHGPAIPKGFTNAVIQMSKTFADVLGLAVLRASWRSSEFQPLHQVPLGTDVLRLYEPQGELRSHLIEVTRGSEVRLERLSAPAATVLSTLIDDAGEAMRSSVLYEALRDNPRSRSLGEFSLEDTFAQLETSFASAGLDLHSIIDHHVIDDPYEGSVDTWTFRTPRTHSGELLVRLTTPAGVLTLFAGGTAALQRPNEQGAVPVDISPNVHALLAGLALPPPIKVEAKGGDQTLRETGKIYNTLKAAGLPVPGQSRWVSNAAKAANALLNDDAGHPIELVQVQDIRVRDAQYGLAQNVAVVR